MGAHVTIHLDPGFGYDDVPADDFDRVTARHAELYQGVLNQRHPEIEWSVRVDAGEGNSIDSWSSEEEREHAEELLDSLGLAGVDPDWQETLNAAVQEVGASRA